MTKIVVLLPGILADARVFGPQLAALSPYFAVSIMPTCNGDRIEEIASGLLDCLPQRFSLLGHDLGGVVAMELQRRAPDRVERIALMNTNALSETPIQSAEYEPILMKLKTGNLDEVVDMLLRPEYLAPSPYRNEVLSLCRDMARNLGADAISRQIRAYQRRRDYQSSLRRSKVPATILCGAHDNLTPVKRHQILAEMMPGSTLQVIEGAGHMPMLEQPDATTDAIFAWLTQSQDLQTAV